MKKIYLLLVVGSFSLMSFAQGDTELNVTKNDSANSVSLTPQDRIALLEKQVQELKTSHAELNKQIAELKSRMPVVKKKKLVASRVGSKQGVWVEE